MHGIAHAMLGCAYVVCMYVFGCVVRVCVPYVTIY